MNTEPRTNEVLLQIRDLWIEGQSGDVWSPIVKGVSLQVHRGEVLGLIGESGAGKSTIGLAAMGFVRPGCRITAGSVEFGGIELLRLDDRHRRELRSARMAYVAQSAAASFNPAHRLIDQTTELAVVRGLKKRSEARAQAARLYEQLRLPEPDAIGRRYPHQVSGGQLQRVMTAMAMLCAPDLIVFDEPTTALDVTTQVEVLAAIRDIVERSHTAAIYITHDLAVVAQMAQRIMVLRHGSTVEEAPTGEMLREPKESYTRSLWAVRSLAKPEITGKEMILRVENVDAAYGPLKVLDRVSVQVPRGCTVAVVGESGSGKSTLARVVVGLLPPLDGRVIFDGKPLPPRLRDRNTSLLRRIQLVFQSADTSLNPRQKVRDAIGRPLEFYLGLTGKARERRTIELLQLTEMSELYLDRFPGELSGGEKQRVCIARALAADPELVICDEVTSALDQIVQEEILKLLMRLQQKLGITYLFITHDIAVVRAIADEIIVMHQGRVVQQGTKTNVLTPPHPDYTGRLLSAVPEMDPDWLSRFLEQQGRTKPSPLHNH